ncbi:MAG: hypothetical protein HOW73_33695 [Polyangiaceae bacterium]|nr:hypothetical protein [Polyangiaceae bacterium]
MGTTSRRSLLTSTAAGGLGLLLHRTAFGQAAEPKELVVPINIATAEVTSERDGKTVSAPVVSRAFVDAQIEAANAVFAAHKIRFVEHLDARALASKHARLETAADRDALADSMLVGVANVFLVESLRDVDDPSLYRMGVCWRKLSDLKKKYVIVTASALGTTLAHELGHFLGNGHSSVKNNLMSYDRDGGKVFLDASQGKKARQTAQGLLSSKQLKTLDS